MTDKNKQINLTESCNKTVNLQDENAGKSHQRAPLSHSVPAHMLHRNLQVNINTIKHTASIQLYLYNIQYKKGQINSVSIEKQP